VSAAAWQRLQSLFSKAMTLSLSRARRRLVRTAPHEEEEEEEEERRLRDLIVQDSALVRLSRAKKILPEPWAAHRQAPLFLADGRWLARWRADLT
jgi:hypothetical protein